MPEAADQLGVSVDALRARIRRGTIAHERVGGRVYIILDPDQDSGQYSDQGPDRDTERDTDQSELVAVLREQLAAEREANREMRRLLAAALERVPPAIDPPEPQNRAQSAEPQSDKGSVPDEPETAATRP